MPYRRNYRRSYRRNPRRRRRYYKKKPAYSYAKMAVKGYYLAKKVMGMVNVEYKHHDLSNNDVALTTVPTTANYILLNAPTVGDTAETRDGSSIRIKRMTVNITFKRNLLSTQETDLVRCMIVLHKQPVGSFLNFSDLLDITTSPINIASGLNLYNKSKFRIMLDKTYHLDKGAKSKAILEYNKPMSLKVEFAQGSGAGTINDLVNWALYLIMWTDNGTSTPTVDYFTRIRYVDN